MADLKPNFNYSIGVTSKEFRLLTLALSRKLTHPDDIEAAQELERKLLQQKIDQLKTELKIAEGALKSE